MSWRGYVKDDARLRESHWHWDWLDGCFGPTRISPMDVDFVVERRGFFLIIETKPPGYVFKPNDGQLGCLRSMSARWNAAVVILWGERDLPTQAAHLVPGRQLQPQRVDRDRIRSLVSQWFEAVEADLFHQWKMSLWRSGLGL